MSTYIDPTAVIDTGCEIGDGTRIWHFSHLISGCQLGENCSIGQNVVIGGTVKIGDGVKIQNNVSVYDGVTVEDDVFIGPSVVFTNVVNPRAFVCRKDEYRPTVLRRGCTVGANATVVCGHEVGEYALIGAGCVVTHDVPAYALIMGNPCRQHGWVSRMGHRLAFGPDGRATCPQTGERYILDAEGRCKPEIV